MKIKAKAKVNLFLHINQKLANGYHALESLVCFTDDIYDEILITETNNIAKTAITSQFSEQIKGENILQKIVQLSLFSKQYNFNIAKNIPVAAGLGGGSSDAGAVLKNLLEMEDIKLNMDQITDICRNIGADVLICFYQKAGYFRGIGDQIIHLAKKIPELYIVLVNPLFPIITKNIFLEREALYSSYLPTLPENFNHSSDLIAFLKNTKNDFQNYVTKKYPILLEILSALEQSPNCQIARMSGTGATFFGIFINKTDAEQASIILKNNFPNYWVKMSKIS